MKLRCTPVCSAVSPFCPCAPGHVAERQSRIRCQGERGGSIAPMAYATAADAVITSAVLWISVNRALARSRSAVSSATIVLRPWV